MAKNQYKCDCKVLHADMIEASKEQMLREKQLSKVHNFCNVIGNRTRLKILWSLKGTNLCVCDIANILSMTKSAISHQLKILRDSNLVKTEKKGKEIFYSLFDEHIKVILNMIAIHVMES